MITAPSLMLARRAAHRCHIGEFVDWRVVAEQGLDAMAQLTTEPVTKGQREPLLWARKYVARNDTVDGSPKQPFRFPTPQRQLLGKRQRELDDVVIQKWDARLERHGHARAINLGEDVTGQIALNVDEHHAREEATPRCAA